LLVTVNIQLAEVNLFGGWRWLAHTAAGVAILNPEIEFIHLAASQNVRFGRSIQHRQ